jgi:hypothetical protein
LKPIGDSEFSDVAGSRLSGWAGRPAPGSDPEPVEASEIVGQTVRLPKLAASSPTVLNSSGSGRWRRGPAGEQDSRARLSPGPQGLSLLGTLNFRPARGLPLKPSPLKDNGDVTLRLAQPTHWARCGVLGLAPQSTTAVSACKEPCRLPLPRYPVPGVEQARFKPGRGGN